MEPLQIRGILTSKAKTKYSCNLPKINQKKEETPFEVAQGSPGIDEWVCGSNNFLQVGKYVLPPRDSQQHRS